MSADKITPEQLREWAGFMESGETHIIMPHPLRAFADALEKLDELTEHADAMHDAIPAEWPCARNYRAWKEVQR